MNTINLSSIFLIVLVNLFFFLQSSVAQPYCGEFDGVLLFDGSGPDPTQYNNLLQLVQGTARSFNWRGAEAARIGAIQFSDVTVEEQDVLYYTEEQWAEFQNTQQVAGPKNISEGLLAASQFVQTAPNSRTQYIILFVTNQQQSASEALDVSNQIKQRGQRIITVFIQDDQENTSEDIQALATSSEMHFVLSSDPATYYPTANMISHALCSDLNEISTTFDECPQTYKIESGMCGCNTYDVNGCGLPVCSIPSTFEDSTLGTDGWKIISTDGVLSEPTVGLYEGGRMSFNNYLVAPQLAIPDEDEEVFPRYFLAPNRYIGAQDQLFGGLITMSLRLEYGFQRFTPERRERLIIEGDDYELVLWKLPGEENIRTDVWSHFNIPVVNTGELMIRAKGSSETRIALEEDVKLVLTFVRSIRILVDFVETYNAASFDNFKYCEISRLNNFEDSEEDYLVLDSMGATPPSWQLNFISFADRVQGESNFNFYYVTPWASGVACEGTDLSDLNGGVIAYDMSLFSVNSEYKPADDVIIVGQNSELIYRLRPEEYPTLNLTHIVVSVSEGSGRWYVSPRTTELEPNRPYPRVAYEEDFVDVLSGVSFIYLRGEFLSQEDTSLLHNALTVSEIDDFCSGNPPCSGNGKCVYGTCECYYGWTGDDCSMKAKCSAGTFKLSNFAA